MPLLSAGACCWVSGLDGTEGVVAGLEGATGAVEDTGVAAGVEAAALEPPFEVALAAAFAESAVSVFFDLLFDLVPEVSAATEAESLESAFFALVLDFDFDVSASDALFESSAVFFFFNFDFEVLASV